MKSFMTSFKELNLNAGLLRALETEGYDMPTPIQAQAIPHVLQGRDLLGCAQTGTGKTAAFALPILQSLQNGNAHYKNSRRIRALILTPTRELASQIRDCFTAYGRHTGLRQAVIFGGVKQGAQVDALRRGVDILVATPGRLIDLCNQGYVNCDHLEIFVLDEADRMLDMGFINDVKRIIKMLPKKRQTLLFSATMPNEIRALADSMLINPVSVAVAPPATTVDLIEQNLYFVEKPDKVSLLVHLMKDASIDRALIFTRTKHGADKLCRKLAQARISSAAIHGNKSQNARERALADFKQGANRVLVATDIASRGIDIDNVSHVINFDLPNEPESYVHRIGRTGRAGMTGIAISFCDESERKYVTDIERTIKKRIPVVQGEYPYRSVYNAPVYASAATAPSRKPSTQTANPARKQNMRRSTTPAGGRSGYQSSGRPAGTFATN